MYFKDIKLSSSFNFIGGPIFRLKGSILCMSFLDCNGALIPYSYEPWKDEGKQRDSKNQQFKKYMDMVIISSPNHISSPNFFIFYLSLFSHVY
jgi:hypothetical protein